MSMKYHPDKNQHLEDNEKIIAEQKMRDINQAYEILKKELNIK